MAVVEPWPEQSDVAMLGVGSTSSGASVACSRDATPDPAASGRRARRLLSGLYEALRADMQDDTGSNRTSRPRRWPLTEAHPAAALDDTSVLAGRGVLGPLDEADAGFALGLVELALLHSRGYDNAARVLAATLDRAREPAVLEGGTWESARRDPTGQVFRAMLAMDAAVVGDTSRAVSLLRSLLPGGPGGPPVTGETWTAAAIARALVATDRLDRQGAAALDVLVPAPSDAVYPYHLYAAARRALVWDGREAALQRLQERSADSLALQPRPRALLLAAQIDLEIAVGNRATARALLGEADHAHPAITLSAARLEMASGSHHDARNVAKAELRSRAHPPRRRAELLLVLAAAEVQLGRRARARAAVVEALQIVRRERVLRPLLILPHATLQDLAADVAENADVLDAPELRSARRHHRGAVNPVRLTRRERAILDALTTEQTVGEIAQQFFVSEATVRSQCQSLYRKLGVHSRHEAVAKAREQGLI